MAIYYLKYGFVYKIPKIQLWVHIFSDGTQISTLQFIYNPYTLEILTYGKEEKTFSNKGDCKTEKVLDFKLTVSKEL